MRLSLYIVLVFCCFCSGGCTQTLLAERSLLLDVSPDSRYIVYFKAATDESDEYVEGQIWIYDVHRATHSLLTDAVFLQNYVGVVWSKSGSSFYLADGEVLQKYSFAERRKDTVFYCGADQILVDFAVSPDDRRNALNVKCLTENLPTQIVMVTSAGCPGLDTVYTVIDSTLGEDLRNEVQFGSSGSRLYVRDLYGRLLDVDLSVGTISPMLDWVEAMYYVDSLYLYYTVSTADTAILYQYDLATGVSFDMMRGLLMRVTFVGPFGEDVAIGLSDNILIYNETGRCEPLTDESAGAFGCVFVNKQFVIQSRDEDLYLLELQ